MRALRIIVVEDDAMIGTLLAETLAGLGHHVCAVEATEAGAVAAAARHGPDLMIVDMHLGGGGGGLSAMTTIARTGPVPHVFITGHRLPAPLPGTVVLSKPFREADLVRAMQRALGMAAAPGQAPVRPSLAVLP